jgi:hypothetical protein
MIVRKLSFTVCFFFRLTMKSCLVCSSRDKLHVFPKDEITLQRWMRILNLRIRPSSSDFICQKHFQPSDIVQTLNGRHKIKPNAVPLQNIDRNSDHTYSEVHKDPYSDLLSLLIMLTPILCCCLPLLIIFFCSLNDYNHHPETGKMEFV